MKHEDTQLVQEVLYDDGARSRKIHTFFEGIYQESQRRRHNHRSSDNYVFFTFLKWIADDFFELKP